MAEWLPLDRAAVAPKPGRIVALGGEERRDHAAWRRRVCAWRAAFAAQAGMYWALYRDDVFDFSACLYGAWHAGKTVYLCGDNLPQTLDALSRHVDGFAGDVPADRSPLRLSGMEEDAPVTTPLDERCTRLVVFTSGSSGEPVAIDKRLAQLAREVEALEASFGDDLGDAIVHGTVSHQHIYGLLFRALWPLAAGRAVAPRLFFPEEIQAELAKGPSLLVASPAHLKRLPETLDWSNVRAMLRAAFSSGGTLPADAAADVQRLLGVPATEIYGSSETGGIAWRRWSGETPAWRALPGVEWRVADGQLEIASPHLADAGWWRNEDRAEADGRGGFRLLGRADNIVKIEERRVSLTALERQLQASDDVAEARVLVLPGARSLLAAVVVPSAQGRIRLDATGAAKFSRRLNAALADGHDAVARPHRWRFAKAMPVNAQGKVTAAALTALFRPERPEPQWLRREARQAELELELSPALAAFDGHFPQAAILPGVAQLDWAIRFGREAFALPPRFLRMEALKFQQVLRPGARVALSLEWLPEKGALQFRYQSAAGTHASGRVLFGEAP